MPYDLAIRGWMGEDELQVIEQLCSKVPVDGIIVEVGCMMGRTTSCIAMSAHPSVKIYSIDLWDGEVIPNEFDDEIIERYAFPLKTDKNSVKTFIENTKKFNNVIAIHFPHTQIPELNPDLVFIDASHTNPSDWEIINFWLPKMRRGGILAGHDYGQEFPDVIENVKKLEALLTIPVTLHAGSLWSFNL